MNERGSCVCCRSEVEGTVALCVACFQGSVTSRNPQLRCTVHRRQFSASRVDRMGPVMMFAMPGAV